MPKPSNTTPTELAALVRIARTKLVEQVNDTNVDAEAIVGRLETFVETLIASHISDLCDQIARASTICRG